jgi:ABC-type multidrug transport system fused ATPase/permease subunit
VRKFIRTILTLGFSGIKKLFVLGIVFSSFYIIFNSAVPYIIQRWVNTSLGKANNSYVYRFGILFAVSMTIMIIFDFLGAYILILLREKLRLSMRQKLLKKVIESDATISDAYKQSGYYTQVLMDDVEKSSSVIVSFVYMVLPAIIGLPAALFFATLINPIFTYSGAVGFILLAALVYFSGQHIRKFSKERQEAYARLGEKITEVMNASLIIKVFCALNSVISREKPFFEKLKETSVRKHAYAYFIQVLSEFISNFIEIAAVLLALIFASRLNITGAGIMAGVVYLTRIWQPVVLIGEINEEMQTSIASVERINKIVLKENAQRSIKQKLSAVSEIECKDVSLMQNGNVIAGNINFSVSKGECAGIKGKSGIGKTTLAKAMLGLHKEYAGRILINGIEITKVANIYEIVGYLPQFVPILSDTLQFNITFSEKFDENKLNYAIKQSGLQSFADKLTNGYQTAISEKEISGGQRKRIGIARLLYRDYDALILDEPFSGVDRETATLINSRIKDISQNKILIIISHDERYISSCDKIVEIK